MIFLVNAREVILTSKKGQSFSKLAKRAVGLGKGTTFQDQFEANLLREARTRSYPESRIYTISRRTYSNPEAGLKAKLNSTTMAMFVLHIPSIKAIQSISKSEPFHCRLSKTLKGVLSVSYTHLTLPTIYSV